MLSGNIGRSVLFRLTGLRGDKGWHAAVPMGEGVGDRGYNVRRGRQTGASLFPPLSPFPPRACAGVCADGRAYMRERVCGRGRVWAKWDGHRDWVIVYGLLTVNIIDNLRVLHYVK